MKEQNSYAQYKPPIPDLFRNGGFLRNRGMDEKARPIEKALNHSKTRGK
ncbi:hypothetical protein [Trichloromonas sp.]